MANGKNYLDSWDEWEKHKKNDGGGNEVVEFKGSSHSSHSTKSTSTTHYEPHERCYHKHPALKLPGAELLIYGGSCLSPSVKDADVYVGFDSGMKLTERSYPWKQGSEFLFKIQDMSVPEKPDEFKKLVGWVKTQLEEGKKVHCGCIGGHGRTGTFLAALCSEYGEKDAIAYVRKNYCQKAVESSSQVAFLHEHYGIKKVDGYKSSSTHTSSMGKGGKSSSSSKPSEGRGEKFTPVPHNGCIFDARPA